MRGHNAKLVPSLAADLKHINIRNFAMALERLADYLDALDMWFGDLVDAKVEYQAKYAREGS